MLDFQQKTLTKSKNYFEGAKYLSYTNAKT